METKVDGVELGASQEDIPEEIVQAETRGAGRTRPKYKDIAKAQARRIKELEEQAEDLALMARSDAMEDKAFRPRPTNGILRTVGGKPIDPGIAHLIPFENTDQGIAEKEAKLAQLAAEGKLGTPGLRFTADAEDKRIDAYEASDTPFGVGSPLVETAAEYRKANPDKAVRYLSEMQISRSGMRGFEWALIQGKPFKVGELQLASIPRHIADSRRRAAVQESSDAMGQKVEEFQVNTEQVNRNAPNGAIAVQPMVGSELGAQGFRSTKVWSQQAG